MTTYYLLVESAGQATTTYSSEQQLPAYVVMEGTPLDPALVA